MRGWSKLCGLLMMLGAAPASAQEADVAALRAAVNAAPNDATAALSLGRALRRAGRLTEAAPELTRGLALGSSRKGGLGAALAYELARVRIDQRDLNGALRGCDGLGKKSALSDACRAEAYLLQNRATDALPIAQKARAADPGLYEARVAEGRALAMMGKVAEADAALRGAAESADGRADAHHHLGLLLLNNGCREAGVLALIKANAADPGDPEIAFHLGEVLPAKDARPALARAVAVRPTYAEAHAELARVALELGDVASAETAATTAIRLDTSLHAAHLHLGRVRLLHARWDDALREGETAKKLLANSPAAELIIADAEAGRGEVDLALDAYQRAYGLDRADPAPLHRAARTARVASRLTTARAFADKLTVELPRFAPGWVELGDVAALQKKPDKARDAYEAALKCDGPAIDRDAVQKKLDAMKALLRAAK